MTATLAPSALDPAGQWYPIYEVLCGMPHDTVLSHPVLRHIWLGVTIDGQVRNGGWPQAYFNLRGRLSLAEMAATCSVLGGEAEARQALRLATFLEQHRQIQRILDDSGPFGLPPPLKRLADDLNDAFYKVDPTLRVRLQEYIWANRDDPALAAAITEAQPYRAYKNQSPLHCACGDGNIALVHRELARGVSPNIEDDNKSTPLFEALGLAKGPLRLQILDVLFEAGADVNRRDWLDRLPPTIVDMDRAIMARLLAAGFDVTQTGRSGSSLLHDVRDVATTRMLLKAGLDPNQRSDYGVTPLHLAASRYAGGLGGAQTKAEFKRSLSVLRVLRKAGAVNSVTPRGQDAFWFAADHDFSVRALMELGLTVMTEIDEDGCEGMTALHRAAANRFIRPVRALIKAGASVNARTRKADDDIPAGATPLTVARIKNQKKIVTVLLSLGAEA
jgi:ankyrin repeat protein